MNEVAFEELLLGARTSESISGLRKLILSSALRGDFDDQQERQRQLSDALNSIQALSASSKEKRNQPRKASPVINSPVGNEFVVELGVIAIIEKGKTGIKDATPGEYPLVVTAEGRLTADHFDFEGPAVVIPLVSSTGHGDASLKRIHYQEGRYAVGSILCAVQSRYPELVHPRYLYEYLSTFKEELLVSRMSGTANVSLTVGKISEVPVPLITYEAQEKLDRLMSLCDALEAQGQLEAEQHARLVSTLFDSLLQSDTPAALADNWQRIATHFDVLLDRPEAVDTLEQTILQLAVRGLLVPQDPSDEPASELLKKIRAEKDQLIAQGKIKRDKPLPSITDEEKPFELPQGWEWVRMGAVINSSEAGWSPTCLGVPRTKGKWGVLKVSAVSWGEFDATANKELPANLEPRPEYEVKEGDFLLSRANTAELVARSVVVKSVEPRLMLSDKIIRLTVSCEMSQDFLNLCNNAAHARSHYAKNASGTSSSMKNVSRDVVLAMPVPLPPQSEQFRIVTRVNELRSLCADLRSQLQAAQSTQVQLASALAVA